MNRQSAVALEDQLADGSNTAGKKTLAKECSNARCIRDQLRHYILEGVRYDIVVKRTDILIWVRRRLSPLIFIVISRMIDSRVV